MRFKTTALVICMAFVAMMVTAAPAAAGMHVSPLSGDHTVYGVSQYQAGNAGGDGCKPKIMNPTGVTMVAIALLYVRSGDGPIVDPGEFDHCAVAEIGPHSIVTVDGLCPSVTEVIAVPKDPVMVNGQMTRVADGLGVQTHLGSYGGGPLNLMHPSLFSGPADSADRKAAATCIKTELKAIGINPAIFIDFAGIFGQSR